MNADLAKDLARALEVGEVVPYFQPIMELRSGHLAGFEVLARWNHPVRGLVLPDDFIPVAESAGLLSHVTENLLAAAFKAAVALPEWLRLAINISTHQLRDRTLPQRVASVAASGGFSLTRLTIEITESALIGNLELARVISNELKALGVRLAIDDFGTGYSSLRYLQALPFDELKVDGTFVRSLKSSRESRKIAAAVVGLGQTLGLITVAEGIEEKAQADMLFYFGCDMGQGWLYGRPVPAPEIAAIVASGAFSQHQELPRSPLAPDGNLGLDALPGYRFAQLQAIYDGTPVGMCFLDRNLRYVSINKRLAEMNGYPVAAHIGRHVQELLPEIYNLLEPHMQQALRGEPVPGFEIHKSTLNRPGTARSVLISYQPARDEAGEVVGISVSVVDISEYKRLEAAHLESEDQYRTAVELSPQVPWTAAPDGRILDASPRWEVLTGLRREETLGWGWLRALHPEDADRTVTAWKHSLGTGEPVDVEYRIRQRDGSWLWMRARATARRGPSGEVLRWYGTVEDIDQYKKIADALRESEDRLRMLEERLERQGTGSR